MKKYLSILIVIMIVVSFSACASKEERAYMEAVEAYRTAYGAYEDAVDDYNKTKKLIDDYNRAVEKVNSFR